MQTSDKYQYYIPHNILNPQNIKGIVRRNELCITIKAESISIRFEMN